MKKTEDSHIIPGCSGISLLPSLRDLLVPVERLTPDPQNPRRTEHIDVLAASVRRFGVRKPIVANARDGLIEAGHQLFQVLIDLGATQVPVVWADDERSIAVAFNVADNRTSEVVAVWDDALLADALRTITEVPDLIDSIGFDNESLNAILDGVFTDSSEDTKWDDPSDIGIQGCVGVTRIVLAVEDQYVNALRREIAPICAKYKVHLG